MILTGKLNSTQYKAISYFDDALSMPDCIVHIKFTKKIPTYGYTDVMDDWYEIVVASDIDENEKIITIAHEMVHVKQFALGELSIDGKTWKGSNDFTGEPWEDEAETLSRTLTEEFYASIRN